MLAAIPRTFFHYTPRRQNTSTDSGRIAIAHDLRQKNFPKNRRPTDFVETLGKLG